MANQAGDYMNVGRTNESEVGTRLVAIKDPGQGDALGGYQFDYVLDVALNDDFVLTSTPTHAVDAIHATGSIKKTIGGEIGTQPAGNGIVAWGVNGIVGYAVHDAAPLPAPRDLADEQAMQAGVLGEGGVGAGVVGRGQTGVIGFQGPSAPDPDLESLGAGVIGYGGIGVIGQGSSGPGVRGIGTTPGAGVSGFPGVHGKSTDGTGVLAEGSPGLLAQSPDDNSGVFEANPHRAQVLIVPMPVSIDSPNQLPGRAGELCVTIEGTVARLWFCVSGGGPAGSASPANWVNIA
jgi:hypothetical protein